MKVLVIGQGGREHAICWKLKQSPLVTELYCAPGNPGIGGIAENIDIKSDDLSALTAFALSKAVDLTVVGPENPLALGIADKFREAGLRVFGPAREAARLESSKDFAKRIMQAAGVPTAEYRTFSDEEGAKQYVRAKGCPIVIKADGLATGKGVFVCQELGEALDAVSRAFNEFKSPKIVIEEFLEGVEVSYIVATNGRAIAALAASHDYKRVRDNDQGPNTGGMGAVSPTPRLTAEQGAWTLEHVIKPVLRQMESEGMPFQGFLYAGLMIGRTGEVKVLEFNVRLGDPETQVILRRLKSDLCQLLYTLSDPRQVQSVPELDWHAEQAVCVVMASEGYPDSSTKGDEITGLEAAAKLEAAVVFHAGTGRNAGQKLVTNGGRVLNVTALGKDLSQAGQRAYDAVGLIKFRGCQYRSDIG